MHLVRKDDFADSAHAAQLGATSPRSRYSCLHANDFKVAGDASAEVRSLAHSPSQSSNLLSGATAQFSVNRKDTTAVQARAVLSRVAEVADWATHTFVLLVHPTQLADILINQTLVGEYKVVGLNHDRQTFQKYAPLSSDTFTNVFVFYWANRDGEEFAGWWFGDAISGKDAWAMAPSHEFSPP